MAGTPKGRQTTAVHACIDPIGASMQQTVLELPGSQRKYPIPRAKPERLSSGPSAHYGAAGSQYLRTVPSQRLIQIRLGL